jgi:Ca-activated chloride channel family protein
LYHQAIMGFAAPLALSFAVLYGVLVLLYLWERWRRRVEVPSLLLWETVREDTLRARRFRPDLLFILQALLLTGLIGGLARPYLVGVGGGQPRGRHIFVLDTSASMQARELRTTRFERARAQALQRLDDVPAGDEVMLIGAGHAPEVLADFTRDVTAVRRTLQQATPGDVGGDITLALAFAASARQRSDVPATVEVFTDMARGQLPAPLRDEVTVFQVGESDDNIGIEALQIHQGRFQDYTRARAYILVENFAHREGHGFLSVQVEDRVVERSGFTIPSRQSKGFLVHDFPGPGRVMAHLEVNDALAADDTAFGWIRPVTPTRILVVSPPSPLLDDLKAFAAAAPGVQLTVVEPQAFTSAAARAPPSDLVIFHRFVPPGEPPSNALYIYPPADNTRFPVSGDATNVEVLDWNAHHPALQSLRPLASLPLQRARIVTPPPTSQVLLWSRTADREFPLAFGGEQHGRRFACVTFDLEAEHLLSSDNVNLFLFFVNLLAWLAPEHDGAVVMHTGDVQTIGPFPRLPVQVRDPRGGLQMLASTPPAIAPLFAGEYRLSADGTRHTVLANFFDPLESDIGRTSKEPPIFHPAAAPPRTAAPLPRQEYGSWLYVLAAAVFVSEWLIARRVTT